MEFILTTDPLPGATIEKSYVSLESVFEIEQAAAVLSLMISSIRLKI